MESAYLVTAFIILLPLIPAACTYWLLTPNVKYDSGGNIGAVTVDRAQGDIRTSLGPTVFGIKFNVVGSTAFYIVVLIITFCVYTAVEMQAQNLFDRQQSAIKDGTAWLVELPVAAVTRDSSDSQRQTLVPIDANMQSQLQIAVQPSYLMYGDSIQFWVIPTNKRFPKVTISLPNVSSTPPIDLNDTHLVKYDYSTHTMEGIGKQWLQIQKPYDPKQASAPQLLH
ncbi:hypothetical protein [Paraburkholderia sp. J10-1]|uniref:hypothetical protein n=1 Tax=Paraburkholderia sp. J10-1 TaxID=2805430 RepID=UPI002AB66564|nr:hypothetical protein [Paraburkholderia sp. J10-1]